MSDTDVVSTIQDKRWFSTDDVASLADCLEDSMARHASTPALVTPGQTLTFQQVEEVSRCLAAALRETWGALPGERIAVVARPAEQLVLLLASLRAGLLCALIDPAVSDAELLDELHCIAPALLVSNRDLSLVTQHLPSPPKIIRAPSGKPLIGWAQAFGFLKRRGVESDELRGIIRQGKALSHERHEQGRDALLLMASAGYGRRLLLTNGNLLTAMGQIASAPGVDAPQGPVLAAEPFHDAINLLLQVLIPWALGITVVLVMGRSPQRALAMARRWRCRLLYARESTILHWQREGLDQQLDSLELERWWDSPAAMTPPQRHNAFHRLPSRQRWLRVRRHWPVFAIEQGDSERGNRHAILLSGVQLALASENAEPNGAVGRLWLSGRHVMAGFWRQPVVTAAQISVDGWLKTGLKARMNGNGSGICLEATDPAATVTLQNFQDSRS